MSFWDRMKEALEKGVSTSKEVFDKTKKKAKDLGDMGALKLAISKLERQAEERFSLIGTRVYDLLIKKERKSVSKSTPEIRDLLSEIIDIKKNINKKEKELKKYKT
ncbi:MAG: hypothetical protein JSV25_11910 [Spirochaetota bacterium]|nr:MAG: hypothetical protein JSV25_11910 [Spirochaetota bacterium]